MAEGLSFTERAEPSIAARKLEVIYTGIADFSAKPLEPLTETVNITDMQQSLGARGDGDYADYLEGFCNRKGLKPAELCEMVETAKRDVGKLTPDQCAIVYQILRMRKFISMGYQRIVDMYAKANDYSGKHTVCIYVKHPNATSPRYRTHITFTERFLEDIAKSRPAWHDRYDIYRLLYVSCKGGSILIVGEEDRDVHLVRDFLAMPLDSTVSSAISVIRGSPLTEFKMVDLNIQQFITEDYLFLGRVRSLGPRDNIGKAYDTVSIFITTGVRDDPSLAYICSKIRTARIGCDSKAFKQGYERLIQIVKLERFADAEVVFVPEHFDEADYHCAFLPTFNITTKLVALIDQIVPNAQKGRILVHQCAPDDEIFENEEPYDVGIIQ